MAKIDLKMNKLCTLPEFDRIILFPLGFLVLKYYYSLLDTKIIPIRSADVELRKPLDRFRFGMGSIKISIDILTLIEC